MEGDFIDHGLEKIVRSYVHLIVYLFVIIM